MNYSFNIHRGAWEGIPSECPRKQQGNQTAKQFIF
jgi:hypothetical protein